MSIDTVSKRRQRHTYRTHPGTGQRAHQDSQLGLTSTHPRSGGRGGGLIHSARVTRWTLHPSMHPSGIDSVTAGSLTLTGEEVGGNATTAPTRGVHKRQTGSVERRGESAHLHLREHHGASESRDEIRVGESEQRSGVNENITKTKASKMAVLILTLLTHRYSA